MKNVQVIKSMTDANRLLDRGNHIIKIDRDRNDRSKLIFIFLNSVKLQNDLKEISDRPYGYDYK